MIDSITQMYFTWLKRRRAELINHFWTTQWVCKKMINSVMDLTRWKKSLAYVELMDFIGTVNSAVVSTSISENQNHSENISKVSLLMSKLKNHVDEVPLDQDTQRFGNKAFRTWFHWLSENAGAFCSELLIGLEISGLKF
uniref:Serine/threonine-protein phosphatase 2A activator n=1 Tax=Schistocephalus solidus TaxID=70667 RepID=A0A0X3P3A2_SCHSO